MLRDLPAVHDPDILAGHDGNEDAAAFYSAQHINRVRAYMELAK